MNNKDNLVDKKRQRFAALCCADVHNEIKSELTGNYKIITKFVTASEKIILSNDSYTRPKTEKILFSFLLPNARRFFIEWDFCLAALFEGGID